MSKNKDYTSTTVSSSLRQYDNSVGPTYQVPFSLSPGHDRLRKMCLPYVGGGTPNGAFMFDRDNCAPVTIDCSCAVRYALSGSGGPAGTWRMDLGTSLNMKNDVVNSPNGWTMAFWFKQRLANAASILYSRGYATGAGTLSHFFATVEGSTAGANNTYVMYLGSLAGPVATVLGGSAGNWNLLVFQASASAGSLTGSITVVSSSGGYETSASANPIGSGTGSTNTNNYIGAYAATEYAGFLGGLTGSIADFAIWDKTLSQAEITGTLWNGGKPLCLTNSILSGNLKHWLRMGDGENDTAATPSGDGWIDGAVYDQTGSLTGSIVGFSLGASKLNLVSLSAAEAIYVTCSSS